MTNGGARRRRAREDRLSTIDLRRARMEGPAGSALPSRRFYVAVLVATMAASLAGLLVELASSVRRGHSPLGSLEFQTLGMTSGVWLVAEATDREATWALEDDSLISLNGIFAAEIRESEAARRALDDALKAGAPIRVEVGRSPSPRDIRWSCSTTARRWSRESGVPRIRAGSSCSGLVPVTSSTPARTAGF